MQQFGHTVSPHVASTLVRMKVCRTISLGWRTYRCDGCNYQTTVYNSCGDRHCPNCSGAKRRDWLDSSRRLLLPGVTYFQVVFTLPEQLSSLALGNRRVMYNMLFKTAWAALKGKIENELGIQSSALAVLHTWNQELGHHPHVHMLVPGNGLSLDGQRWLACRTTKKGEPFLVDNKELGHEFRDLFLDELEQAAQTTGGLELEEACFMADLIGDLRQIDWNVFISGPPKADCPPEEMLKYLTRYLTGGPISDQRIIGEKDGRIWFNARRRDKQPSQEQRSLPVLEFVRRWTMHILPQAFTKVRHFGCWTSTKRTAHLAASSLAFEHFQASQLTQANLSPLNTPTNNTQIPTEQATAPSSDRSLDLATNSATTISAATIAAATIAQLAASTAAGSSGPESAASLPNQSTTSSGPASSPSRVKCCPHCQAEMKCIDKQDRPAWREIFYGPSHPWWYEWISLGLRAPTDQELAESQGRPIPHDQLRSAPEPELELEQPHEPDIFDLMIAENRRLQLEAHTIPCAPSAPHSPDPSELHSLDLVAPNPCGPATSDPSDFNLRGPDPDSSG